MAKDHWKLTALEIESILDAAGNCDVPAMFEDEPDRRVAARRLAAYERGVVKLMGLLAQMRER